MFFCDRPLPYRREEAIIEEAEEEANDAATIRVADSEEEDNVNIRSADSGEEGDSDASSISILLGQGQSDKKRRKSWIKKNKVGNHPATGYSTF